MKNLVLGIALCLSVGGFVSAQDAVKALPNAYALQFENEWVRIVRVRYEPFAKLPGHEHTRLASAYVYLNDGGPVIFKHVGKEYGDVTRPATKARSFRLYRGLEEIHEVENTSELPSEFLRIEFKTDPKDANTLRGKFFSEADRGEQRTPPVRERPTQDHAADSRTWPRPRDRVSGQRACPPHRAFGSRLHH